MQEINYMIGCLILYGSLRHASVYFSGSKENKMTEFQIRSSMLNWVQIQDILPSTTQFLPQPPHFLSSDLCHHNKRCMSISEKTHLQLEERMKYFYLPPEGCLITPHYPHHHRMQPVSFRIGLCYHLGCLASEYVCLHATVCGTHGSEAWSWIVHICHKTIVHMCICVTRNQEIYVRGCKKWENSVKIHSTERPLESTPLVNMAALKNFMVSNKKQKVKEWSKKDKRSCVQECGYLRKCCRNWEKVETSCATLQLKQIRTLRDLSQHYFFTEILNRFQADDKDRNRIWVWITKSKPTVQPTEMSQTKFTHSVQELIIKAKADQMCKFGELCRTLI